MPRSTLFIHCPFPPSPIHQVSVYSAIPDAIIPQWEPEPPPPSEKATKACSVTHHYKASKALRLLIC